MQAAVLGWYAATGRRLAFRGSTDPYAIIVSELMAQQTQAARAAEAWRGFLATFPTFAALAEATPAAVIRAWRGLGYNRRALALRRIAIAVVDLHGGQLPEDIQALERLPGIGPYTARAVAALAFGQAVGPVDTNVRRVLTRAVLGLEPGRPGGDTTIVAARLQRLADAAVPPGRGREWTHAVMDVGAVLCRPRAPRCSACPVLPWCGWAGRSASVAEGEGAAVRRRHAARSRGAAASRTAPVSDSAARSRTAPVSDSAQASRTPAASRPFDAATADAPRRVAERRAPFAATTRWLRGRILARLCDAPDGHWVELGGWIGDHGPVAVAAAVEAMRRDGLAELHPSTRGLARLPLA